MLDIVVRQLKRHGFLNITFATGYLAELVEAFFRDGSAYGVEIDYAREVTPLGTAGPLASVSGLDADFLVMNGDTLTDMDYGDFFDAHVSSGAAATIATTRRDVEITLGVLRFGDGGDPDRLTGYDEKPVIGYDASMGIYCFSPSILSYIEPNVRLDFPDLILRLLAAGEVVRAWRSQDFWLDIGRPEDYEQASNVFDAMRRRLIPET